MENLKTRKLATVMGRTVSTGAEVNHVNASRLIYDNTPYVKFKAKFHFSLCQVSQERETL